MASPGASLKSTLRKSVLGAYRARGKSINNLWLVYSVKTDSDWILPSDRQLIHWLYFLEANPEVSWFDLAPEPVLSHDGKEQRATELDAIVTLRDGQTEWHEVKSGHSKRDPLHESQMLAQANAASAKHIVYKRFNDTDLKPKVQVALRWNRAISYAAAIRGEAHHPSQTAIVLAMKDLHQGTIQQLLAKLDDQDPMIVLGILVRLSINGIVRLDLEKTFFGLQTSWTYHE